MSEYQYYEFQTVEKRLTAQEQQELRQLSSRVQLTPTQATFVYNYGDFRGDPYEVLTQYFEMMFYIANWGTWQLLFKFPKSLVNSDRFHPYLIEDAITLTETPEYLILDLMINDEEELLGWTEGEGWLSRLLPLREELLAGDLRLLYLTWLRVASMEMGYNPLTDPVEPPIPANLGQVSEPLKAWIDLIELDSDLVTAGAEASVKQTSPTQEPLEPYLSQLSSAESQDFLRKLLRREANVDLQLTQRLQELAGTSQNLPLVTPGNRRISQLQERAEAMKAEREEQERKLARKKRIQALEALASQAEATWTRVVQLIERKQAKSYDEATALLLDLRELAEYQGTLPDFQRRFTQLHSEYSNRPALMRRFQEISAL